MNVLGVYRSGRVRRHLVVALALYFLALGPLCIKYVWADDASKEIRGLRDPYRREHALRALVKSKDPKAVELLIAALKGADWDLRKGIEKGLVEIGAPAVEPLITALSNSDPDVRSGAAQALGEIKDARAVAPLIAALKDAEWRILDAHQILHKALVEIGAPAVGPLVAALEDLNIRRDAAIILGEIKDPGALNPLIACTKDSDLYFVDDVRTALTGFGALAVEPLNAALKDPNLSIEVAAAQVLGNIKDPRAVEPLISTLKSANWRTRSSAIVALGNIRDARAVDPLLAAMGDVNREVRGAAAIALGMIDDSRAVEPLIIVLRDPDWMVREDAATALGEIKNSRAVEPLVSAMKDASWPVRLNAQQALAKIGAPAVEPLTTALTDTDSDVRERAALALGAIKDPRAVEPLIAALKDQDVKVRSNAAEALGEINDPRGANALLSLIGEHDLAGLSRSYSTYIRKGEPGTEYVLILALNAYGDEAMADTYLNCGNAKLAEAAKRWGTAHGYVVVRRTGGEAPDGVATSGDVASDSQ